MARQKRQLESFDVSEFLRPTDEDLKSALSSLLRDGNNFDPQSALGNTNSGLIPDLSPPVNLPTSGIATSVESAASDSALPSSSVSGSTVGLTSDTFSSEPSLHKNNNQAKLAKRGITPVNSSFEASLQVKRAKAAYRLNRTELILYEMFLKWTHAVGKTRCEATNRKICEFSGLIEKSVRRNLRSLQVRGLVTQVKMYDPYTHEPASYDVFLVPLSPS
jgi:hypothetical protein